MTIMEDGEVYQEKLEGRKLFYDSLKHLTTLNTGSVLILAAFLERFFNRPEWKFLVGVSFVGFAVSILSSVVGMTIVAMALTSRSTSYASIGKVSIPTAWGSFFLAIASLIVFVLKNFF